ncbi:hypothetical protein V8E54_008877 [Elaphomyces granulatus]
MLGISSRFFMHLAYSQPKNKYIIRASDPMPGWNLRDHFQGILKAAHRSAGRSLILVHYAGYGKIDASGQWVFLANAKMPRSFSFHLTFFDAVAQESMFSQMNPQVHVVFIIDSCYSGQVTRAIGGPARIFEVLAAVEADKTALGT